MHDGNWIQWIKFIFFIQPMPLTDRFRFSRRGFSQPLFSWTPNWKLWKSQSPTLQRAYSLVSSNLSLPRSQISRSWAQFQGSSLNELLLASMRTLPYSEIWVIPVEHSA